MKSDYYRCSWCGGVKNRDDLLAMRVQYITIGKPSVVKRSRVVAWVCAECVTESTYWKTEPWIEAPGIKGKHLDKRTN